MIIGEYCGPLALVLGYEFDPYVRKLVNSNSNRVQIKLAEEHLDKIRIFDYVRAIELKYFAKRLRALIEKRYKS
jgi:hypothetical protein